MNDSSPNPAKKPSHPLWLANLVNGLIDKPVAILHRNVRDLYIEDKQTVHEDLAALIKRIAQILAQHQLPFSEIVRYDPGGLERRIPLAHGATPTATPKNSPPARAGLLPESPAAEASPEKRIDDPQRALAGWLQELSRTDENRLAVLGYLDKFVAYNQVYTDPEKQFLLRLEKIIDKITNNNRLIIIAIQDTMLPVELYTRAPKVFLQPIPLPDAEDREAYLRHRLGDLETDGRLSSDQLNWLGQVTDGLYLRDLENLRRPLRALKDFGTPNLQRLLNRYRFGEQKDHFGQLDIRRINSAVRWFEQTEHVKGQTEAIRKVVDVLTLARAGLTGVASGAASKPKGVLFFAGPSGVGKTLVAKKLAKFLFGSEAAFLRFDMSEFKEEHTVSKLIGSPPGYVGSEQGGMLTNGVREKPFSVVLFDEVEKAHPKIMDVFLQILDDGRLTDSRGQTVFFTESIVVFTSNIGTRGNADERQRLDALLHDAKTSPADRPALVREHFRRSVQDFFRQEISRPELLNRFGRNIVAFNFIDSPDTQREIVAAALGRIKSAVEEKCRGAGHAVQFDAGLPDRFVRLHGLRLREFGGRGIMDALEGEILLPLSRCLLDAEFRGVNGLRFVVALDGEDHVRISEQPKAEAPTP